MTQIERLADCGNSPKNKFVEDMTIALATSDLNYLLDRVTDDVRWDIVGRDLIAGETAFAEAAGSVMSREPLKLSIQHVATHGYVGAADGTLLIDEAENRRFCNVYEFSNSRGTSVKAITSYVVDRRDADPASDK